MNAEPRPIGTSAALLTVARLSSALALFGVTVVAARLLTPDEVGSAAVGQVIGTLAALLASGGLNISTIYFLRRSPTDASGMVGSFVALAIGSCLIAFALGLVSAPIAFGPILGAPNWPLIASAGLLGASVIAYEFCGALLLAMNESRRFVLLEVVRGWGSLAGAVILLALLRADIGLVLGLAIGFGSAALIGLRRAAARASLRPRLDPRTARRALSFGVRGQVGNVLQFLGVRLDLLLVPALLNLDEAGLYYIAVRVSDLVGQAATASASFLFPHIAGQQDHRDTQMTERVTRGTLLVTLLAAIAVAAGALPLLQVAFGSAYVEGTPTLLVLLVAVVPLSIGRVISADLKGRGRPGTVSIAAVVSVAATIVLDLVLIPGMGIIGAAIASLVAYSLMTAALLYAYRVATGGMLTSLVPGLDDLRDLRTLVDRRLARRGSTDR
ncbi:MAG TPA: oligosaccharide flippase family protein [Candidatus Limnocylindria bacterium]|nr:oligosaccharide flippase family protein [Candidatus Limnocylindria bacterium]